MSIRKSFGLFLILLLGVPLLASNDDDRRLPFFMWSREDRLQVVPEPGVEESRFGSPERRKGNFADSGPQEIKPPMDEYISALQASAPYIPLEKLGTASGKIPETITREQARADIDMLEYLLEHAYSGKDYWSKNGVGFEGLIAELRSSAEGSGTFPVAAFEEIVCRGLQKIQDGHLGVRGFKRHRFFKHEDAFFADLLIEKKDGSFIVVDSQVPGLSAGDSIRVAKENLFPTLSPSGKSHFLIGLLSASAINDLQIQSRSGSSMKIPLHRCRLSGFSDEDTSVFSSTAIEGVPHIRVRSFSTDFNKELEMFAQSSLALIEKPAVILNVLGNGGGSENYGRAWLRNLNGKHASNRISAVLTSPPIVESWANSDLEGAPPFLQELIKEARAKLEILKKNPRKSWEIWYPQSAGGTGTFKGKLIILMDRWVASSGEGTLGSSRAVKDLLLIGENSAGIGTFGEVRPYILPNSRIQLSLPCKLFLEPGILEGKGFFPNLWLDTSEPLEEIVKWLHEPEGYRFRLDVPTEIATIDFEQWINGKPNGLKKRVGVSVGKPGDPVSLVLRDESTVFEGKASCLLTGDSQTRTWWFLGHPFPVSKKRVSVRFAVKGEGIAPLPHDYNNCYVGFILEDRSGKYKHVVKDFEGTFDWKTETISVDLGDDIVSCEFGIMKSKAGKLWVDDIRFEKSEIPSSTER